ncbi:MAG: DUF167 domain-containing protein [Deltaproteobacteria bacterium]|nr:DUF167 domain-containing protein [Deltaproteobacteria bacterium]
MPDLPPYILRNEQGWYISLKVQPGAKKSELAGLIDGLLRVRLCAPAVENKANQALCEFMAEALQVKKNKVRLASGEKSRLKKLFVPEEAGPVFDNLPC